MRIFSPRKRPDRPTATRPFALLLLATPSPLSAAWPGANAALAASSAGSNSLPVALGVLAVLAAVASIYTMARQRDRRRERDLEELVNSRTESLQREIATRQRAQQRTATFARLGQQLSLASDQVEAARIIVDTADQLIGWDSCCLFAYSAAEDKKIPILGFDTIDGQRTKVPLSQFKPHVDALSRRAIREGAQLLLRHRPGEGEEWIRFGDTSRPSASLLFTPIRNGSDVVGILSIQSYSVDAYSPPDLDTLQTLADYCGGAFARILRDDAMRESQPRLMHQERLAAIGELSAGAAHEFNNILTVVQGNSNLLLSDREKLEPPMREALEEIAASVDRAANLTRQLLTFSRKQYMRPQVLDLNHVVHQITNMLQRLLGNGIEVERHLSEAALHIRADSGMIGQILVNLAVNARHAMPEGGKLKVATNSVEITPFHPHPECRPGRFGSLTVSDTGCGMDSTTLSRIFEPFFTTKPVSEGAGLGLASVYGIVKQHQGWIEVESQVGKGTTFTIYLPLTPEKPCAQPVATEKCTSCEASETILVVEDEPGVRNLVRTILRKRNYVVLEAANAFEALEVWRNHPGKINLLLTDIVLPEQLSGWDLADQLKAIDPCLPVIYTSGYTPEALGRKRRPEDESNFLPKPYPPQKLVDLIHNCLHESN